MIQAADLEYTTPENRGKCFFCGGTEEGYAKRDGKGDYRPSCWSCVKPVGVLRDQKRRLVGSVIPEPEIALGGSNA